MIILCWKGLELMLHGLLSRNYKQALEWELDGEPGSCFQRALLAGNFIKA